MNPGKSHLWFACMGFALFSASAGEPVEGPYRSEISYGESERFGIVLDYHPSRRRSTRAITPPNLHLQIGVDVGIVGHGVEAYLGFGGEVVVADAATDEPLWGKDDLQWGKKLSFEEATDETTSETLTLLRVGHSSGYARFFEIRTGKEKFLAAREETVAEKMVGRKMNYRRTVFTARDEDGKQLRGTPVPDVKVISGTDSLVEQSGHERVADESHWRTVWTRHAGTGSEPPFVDFEKRAVIALFAGAGYNQLGAELTHAIETPDAVELFVKFSGYQSMDRAYPAKPFGFIIMPRIAKPLIVKWDGLRAPGWPPSYEVMARFDALATGESKVPDPGSAP